MASDYRYRLTSRALTDLDDILRYLSVVLSNPGSASRFADKLEDTISSICRFPKSGSRVDNEFLPSTLEIRKTSINNYIMYYLVEEESETILIVRIVYGRRDMNEILRNID